ncbi:uncharacterized protein [Musca autumnalis]|uniref:uncharacterized protein n=1 Tax=Musca autumnalis TaxID=221902 RepID=UPI003CF263D3
MRTIIILSLVAVACAQYNYQLGEDDGGLNGSGLHKGFTNDVENSFLNYAGKSQLEKSNGDNSNVSPAIDPEATSPANEFITYTVDENDFKDKDSDQILQSARKPTRVIFIRGPSKNQLEDAILALGKYTPQTDIYVLSKQPDINELANKLNSINDHSNNRPEVHFVKYRTAEDAVNAQNAIREQYNTLGGTSRDINGGFASSLNFASQPSVVPAAVGIPASTYLPSYIRRFRRY